MKGVEDKKASDFYLGKRVAYIYKVRTLHSAARRFFVECVKFGKVLRKTA